MTEIVKPTASSTHNAAAAPSQPPSGLSRDLAAGSLASLAQIGRVARQLLQRSQPRPDGGM